MLKLSVAQISALSESAERRFMERAVLHLRARCPQVFERAGAGTVERILEVSLARCRAHGSGSQRCVVALAELSLQYERDVYLHDAWVKEILGSEHIEVAEKADRLKTYL